MGPAASPFARLCLALGARLGLFLATTCGAVALVFGLLALAPGDPIDLLPNAEELRPTLEAEWRLDRPLVERYLRYLGGVLTGDLGTSLTYRPGTPVGEVLAGPALRSLGWFGAALALTLAWGTALAALTVRWAGQVRVLVQMVSIAPVFLLAHIAVFTLNEGAFALMQAGHIARPAWFALPDEPSALRTALAVVLLAVGSGSLAEVHQQLEDALGRVLRSGYVDAARARGAPIWPHVALNLVPPLMTVASTRAAFLLGGLVVLEKVLMLQGAGALLWQAAELRDYDLALGVAVLAAVLVSGVRLVTDSVRVALDPRLRGGP